MSDIDLQLSKGVTFKAVFNYRDSDGNPVNLSGYSARMQVRRGYDDTELLVSLTSEEPYTSDGDITIDNSESSITVYIPSSVTSTFDWSIALYDILLISPNQNADIEKIAKGKIFCNKTVTII